MSDRGSEATCPDGARFAGLLPEDFVPPSTTVATVEAGNYVGLPLDEAFRVAEALGLDVDAYDAVESRSIWVRSNWVVVEQSVPPGTVLAVGAEVRLGVDRPDEAAGGDATGNALTPENIERSIAEVFGLSTLTEACMEVPDICYIADIDVSANGMIVTLQIADRDRDYGDQFARVLFGWLLGPYPQLSFIQVNNARGEVLANLTCGRVFPDRC